MEEKPYLTDCEDQGWHVDPEAREGLDCTVWATVAGGTLCSSQHPHQTCTSLPNLHLPKNSLATRPYLSWSCAGLRNTLYPRPLAEGRW